MSVSINNYIRVYFVTTAVMVDSESDRESGRVWGGIAATVLGGDGATTGQPSGSPAVPAVAAAATVRSRSRWMPSGEASLTPSLRACTTRVSTSRSKSRSCRATSSRGAPVGVHVGARRRAGEPGHLHDGLRVDDPVYRARSAREPERRALLRDARLRPERLPAERGKHRERPQRAATCSDCRCSRTTR